MELSKVAQGGEVLIDIFRGDWYFGHAIRMGIRHVDGSMSIAKPLEFIPHERGAIAQPFITMEDPHMSLLAARMHQAGIRLPGTPSATEQSNRIVDLQDHIDVLEKTNARLLDFILKHRLK